jgi:hypothetical protein
MSVVKSGYQMILICCISMCVGICADSAVAENWSCGICDESGCPATCIGACDGTYSFFCNCGCSLGKGGACNSCLS